MNKDVVISVKTVIISLGILLGLYVTYELRAVLSILFVALLLVISLEFVIKRLTTVTFLNKPLSRGIAVFVTYALLILFVALAITTAIPLLISQSQKLINSFSDFLINFEINGQIVFEDLSILDVLSKFTGGGDISSVFFGSLSFISSIFTLLVLSVYMSLDWENIKFRFLNLFTKKVGKDVGEIIVSIERNIGAWVRGELVLMSTVGVFSFFAYFLAGIHYPLALGFIAGMLEIVPQLGPIFTSVIVTAIGFAQSPMKGFLALGISILVQQLENDFLVPRVMGKVSGFRPLIILIALLIGSDFFGIVGAILAVPVTMILGILVRRFVHYPTLKE